MNTKRLEAKVRARNRVNAEINRLGPIFVANFTPLIGKTIMKVGGLREKYKHLVPESPIHFYRNSSNYTLSFTFSATENIEGECSCVYQEETFYVGDFGSGDKANDLVKVYEFVPRRTDYTVEEVLANRAALRKAQETLSAAQSKLYPFGEYDN